MMHHFLQKTLSITLFIYQVQGTLQGYNEPKDASNEENQRLSFSGMTSAKWLSAAGISTQPRFAPLREVSADGKNVLAHLAFNTEHKIIVCDHLDAKKSTVKMSELISEFAKKHGITTIEHLIIPNVVERTTAHAINKLANSLGDDRSHLITPASDPASFQAITSKNSPGDPEPEADPGLEPETDPEDAGSSAKPRKNMKGTILGNMARHFGDVKSIYLTGLGSMLENTRTKKVDGKMQTYTTRGGATLIFNYVNVAAVHDTPGASTSAGQRGTAPVQNTEVVAPHPADDTHGSGCKGCTISRIKRGVSTWFNHEA